MLWKATATAEKEMQNMKHVWKRYLIVTAMTVVLGLSAGCGSAAEDTNNNQNNTQDENTLDGNENKNNNETSPDTSTDMNNDGTNGTNNNMNGATSGEGTVDENGNRLDENGNIIAIKIGLEKNLKNWHSTLYSANNTCYIITRTKGERKIRKKESSSSEMF